MDRTQATCYALIGSAVVLMAVLALELPSLVAPAQAALVDQRGRFTTLTAKVNPGDDGLFVIDQRNEKLMIYYLDTNRNRLEMGRAVDLAAVFSAPPPLPAPSR